MRGRGTEKKNSRSGRTQEKNYIIFCAGGRRTEKITYAKIGIIRVFIFAGYIYPCRDPKTRPQVDGGK